MELQRLRKECERLEELTKVKQVYDFTTELSEAITIPQGFHDIPEDNIPYLQYLLGEGLEELTKRASDYPVPPLLLVSIAFYIHLTFKLHSRQLRS